MIIKASAKCINVNFYYNYTFSLVCVFPGNRTHNLLRCWRNALPLSHTGNRTHNLLRCWRNALPLSHTGNRTHNLLRCWRNALPLSHTGNRTHNLLRCWRNALPLSHTGNRTHNLLRCWRNALPLSHTVNVNILRGTVMWISFTAMLTSLQEFGEVMPLWFPSVYSQPPVLRLAKANKKY